MKKVLTIRQEKKRPLKVNLTTSDTYAEEPARGPRTRNTESVIDGTKMTIKQKEMVPLRVLADDLIRTEDIVNTLDSDATDKPLSAAMGKELREWVDALSPTAMDGYANKSDLDAFEGSTESALEDKASIDGYYSTLTTGAAENLIGEDTVSAHYTRRRSGGGSIGSGAAVLEEIKGNTLVWNQLMENIYSDVMLAHSGSNSSITFSGHSASWTPTTGAVCIAYVRLNPNYQGYFPFAIGHKIYIARSVKTSDACLSNINDGNGWHTINYTADGAWHRYSQIETFTSYTNQGMRLLQTNNLATVTGPIEIKDILLIDLTQMFGAGNEPATAAEFEAMFPLNYYAYNAGSLLNLTATGLQTNGFNQWDEEWENGKYNTTTGEADDAPTQIRSKNYIPVFGGTDYYFQFPLGVGNLVIMRYDIDKNYLGYNAIQPSVRTLSADTRFIRFYMTVTYGTTYNHDICINFSWSGLRDGEYEAYWQNQLDLPVSSVTGKAGGVGESETIFPDGMRAVGTVRDELTSTKAVKRIASVNLGSLSWTYSSDFRSSSIASLIKAPTTTNIVPNIVCSKYPVSKRDSQPNLSIGVTTGGNLVVIDTNYTNATTFKAAMNGVYLYYELAEPVEYVLDTPLNLNYKVEDWGTETLLPANTASTPTTTPIIATVRYPLDAAGTINHLPKNYTSKPTMDNILTAFKTAGLISGFTLEYNEEHENYDCDIE